MNASTTIPSPVLTDEEFILEVLAELIANYVDLQGREITRTTHLAQIGVDSLTAAEVLFELEDRLDMSMGEPSTLPVTVGDVVDYALPFVAKRARVPRVQ